MRAKIGIIAEKWEALASKSPGAVNTSHSAYINMRCIRQGSVGQNFEFATILFQVVSTPPTPNIQHSKVSVSFQASFKTSAMGCWADTQPHRVEGAGLTLNLKIAQKQ